MERIELYTIGFTKKNAETFFTRLKKAGAKRIVDVRLNNSSQLAGFAKRDDLAFFLRELNGMGYVHRPELAPTQEILDGFKKQKGTWADYERDFLALMAERRIEDRISPEEMDGSCLLCSEQEPQQCHRRLVAEYLNDKWGNITIHHIV